MPAPEDGTALGKPDLRARLLSARWARSAHEIESARVAIAGHVLAWLARAGPLARVAAYEPLRTEPGSIALVHGIAALGVEVIVPALLPDRDLDWAAWPSTDRLGVDAIGACELVLVPALAVDRGGVRLGRGGGSYDRALRRVQAGTPVVALVYDDELLDAVPADDWDLPVTDAVTPAGWHQFPAPSGGLE